MFRIIAAAAFLIALAAACCEARPARGPESLVRAGGPEVILEPVPGSGSVLAAVAVEAGSAWETPRTRGVTHLLEHLLFNGSERFSREEISRWVDESGAFLNAFTRKETTVFFLLARRDLLEESLEILSQMLLHPLFVPHEIEKERAVVLEEIALARGSERGRRAMASDRFLYRGSPLAEPVLGYPATIEAITREEIIAYHGERYDPRRMRIVLMGGFEREAALGWIDDYFTRASSARGARPAGGEARDVPSSGRRAARGPGSAGEREDSGAAGADEPRWSGEVTLKPANGEPERLELLIKMPRPGERLFPAALVLADILAGDASPLAAAAREAGLAPPTASLEAHRSFGALRLVFEPGASGGGQVGHDDRIEGGAVGRACGGGEADSGVRAGGGLSGMPQAVAGLAGWIPEAETLETARTAYAAAQIFDRERYHYFVMRNGEAIALAGREYLEALDAAGAVTTRDIGRLSEECFGRMRFNGVHFTGISPVPAVPERSAVLGRVSAGADVAVIERPGSSAAALTVLFPGRGCAPGVPAPAAALLHGVIAHGEPGRELARELASIGARLAWDDNPYVPMDDYLVSPAFSFVTLEAPAERLEVAAGVLFEFLAAYRVDEAQLGDAAAAVARESAARAASPAWTVRSAVYARLYPSHPYGAPLVADGSVSAVDAPVLEAARLAMHQAAGTAVALVSPLPASEGLVLVERVMGGMTAGARPVCPAPEAYEAGVVEGGSKREGALLAAGWRIDALDARRAAALEIACEALSVRMQRRIRETLGLAYSTGCALQKLPEAAVAIASVTTRPENIDQAFGALAEEVERLTTEPPGESEIAAARSRVVSRMLRRRLSSAGESFALAGDVLLRGGRCEVRMAAGVPGGEVAAAAGLLAPGRAVFVRLHPEGESGEKTPARPGMMGR